MLAGNSNLQRRRKTKQGGKKIKIKNLTLESEG
jgi:hypothetical protein